MFDTLKAVLYTDSAVAGEAAGLAMGLVMLGTAKEAVVQEMVRAETVGGHGAGMEPAGRT